MAEENDGVAEDQQAAEDEARESAQEGAAPQETEQPNGADALEHWKSMSRRNERDAKKAREELAAAQEAGSKALADLATANARIAELEAEAAHEAAVREVAAKSGYPEVVVRGLRGTTVEELTEGVDALRANLSAYPASRDAGDPGGTPKKSVEQQFADAVRTLFN